MKMSRGNYPQQGGMKREQAQERAQERAQGQVEVQSLSVSDLKIDSITVDNEGLGFAMVDIRGHGKPYMLQLNRESRGESLSLDLKQGDGPALLEDLGVEQGDDQRRDKIHSELADLVERPAQEEFDRLHSDGDSVSDGVRALTIAEAKDLPVDIRYVDDDPMVGSPSVRHMKSEESGMHYITIGSPDRYSVTWEVAPEAMDRIKTGVASAEYTDRGDARFRDAWLQAAYDAGLRNEDYLSPMAEPSQSQQKTIEEIRDQLLAVDGVKEANIWQNHGKERVYLELPKLNGGKNWNGGRAGTVFYDADEGVICYRGDWAGAKTRDCAIDIMRDIESATGIRSKKIGW